MSGIFYGIGVGPGDPELLTMKAIHVMEKVDVLIAPNGKKGWQRGAFHCQAIPSSGY